MNASEILKRYQEAMSSSQTRERYKQGVQSFQGNPMELAAAPEAEALYLQRVQESVSSGRRRQALLDAPKTRWLQNSLTKGAERLQSGAKASEQKHMAVLQKWAPIYEQAKAAAAALPKGDLDAGMARCRAAAEVMRKAAGK